jgi:glyoxylase-like metal-dependent hydrolase (beta-lactamase superfamily II)
MTRAGVLGALIGVGALTVAVAGYQAPPAPAPLPDLVKVKDNLYIIEASSPVDRSKFTGGNTGVFVMDTGVLVVDTKLANYGPTILERIRRVTDKPVTAIINTHTHGDHTGSNEGFPASVEIVAHENTKANMQKMDAFKGDKAKFLPKRTFTDKLTLFSGKNEVQLFYFGKGHTSGDAWVYYPALRVLQTGDMFAWHDAPLCDVNNGGSGVEFPRTIAKALATIKNVDAVIPGHSPVATLKDLEEYQRFTADLLASAQASMTANKTAEEAATAASASLLAKYKDYKADRVKGAIDAIYSEIKK